ncbi:MAG: uroporphyrinogen-III synthase [Pseudomonadota bacterium]|nr:uroporphyrinogen-III synthase [Pseudomonadota bacterium]
MGNAANRPLEGTCVVVTRPAHQAQALCEKLGALGAEVERFPAMDIEPVHISGTSDLAIRGKKADWLIFISANAIRCALQLAPALIAETQAKVATVGPATARAFEAIAGRAPDVIPDGGFTSEGLLACAALQAVENQQILIVRGVGGREILARTLRERGAQVTYAEVYQRRRPKPDSSEIQKVWLSHAHPLVVTATSQEVLANLKAMLAHGPAAKRLADSQLVVVNEAMVKMARDLGFREPALLAAAANDDAVVQAILHWRKTGHHPGEPAA